MSDGCQVGVTIICLYSSFKNKLLRTCSSYLYFHQCLLIHHKQKLSCIWGLDLVSNRNIHSSKLITLLLQVILLPNDVLIVQLEWKNVSMLFHQKSKTQILGSV